MKSELQINNPAAELCSHGKYPILWFAKSSGNSPDFSYLLIIMLNAMDNEAENSSYGFECISCIIHYVIRIINPMSTSVLPVIIITGNNSIQLLTDTFFSKLQTRVNGKWQCNFSDDHSCHWYSCRIIFFVIFRHVLIYT